jgi:hypothetical protein
MSVAFDLHGGGDARRPAASCPSGIAHCRCGDRHEAGADWFERVLRFDFVREFQVAHGAAGPGTLFLRQHSGFLRMHVNHAGRAAYSRDARRTDLAHIAFEVAHRAEFFAHAG